MGAEEVTPKELVLLVQAARQQYISFDVDYSRNSYRYSNNKIMAKPYEIHHITWRYQKDRTYCKRVREIFKNLDDSKEAQPKEETRTYVITPQWLRRLVEKPEWSRQQGLVTRKRRMTSEVGVHVANAMWDEFERYKEILASDEATVVQNLKDGCYILTVKTPEYGKTISITIDPSKGYLPNKSEIKQPDGTPFLTVQCDDFRKLKNGLWLPYKYVWNIHNKYHMNYEVEKAKVNTEIPDELLDFSFPAGTIVNDQIANLKYVVDEMIEEDEIAPLDVVSPDFMHNTELPTTDRISLDDIMSSYPAKEEDLSAAAEQADELLNKQTKVQGQTSWRTKSLVLYLIVFPVVTVVTVVLLRRLIVLVKKH